jgi:hypothetical protein
MGVRKLCGILMDVYPSGLMNVRLLWTPSPAIKGVLFLDDWSEEAGRLASDKNCTSCLCFCCSTNIMGHWLTAISHRLRWLPVARIVVVTHEFDQFCCQPRFRLWRAPTSHYLLFDVLKLLRGLGHSWTVVAGPRRARGDVAFLHVDCTQVAEDYLGLAREFEVSINFNVQDISKRHVSGAVLTKAAAWRGPVIVKSDLNCMGWGEASQNGIAKSRGRPLPHPDVVLSDGYIVLPSIHEVQEHIWSDHTKVVERFIPEPDKDGFALRTWVFMGERERCTRHVCRDPIIKGENVLSRTVSAVPEALRTERGRLGFDYGKFDFVLHDGVPVLLDANRTPGSSVNLRLFVQDGMQNLALGLHQLISNRLRH